MHIPTLLLSLVLSTAVVANGKGNKTEKGLSTEDTCKEMRGLQSLITLASNTTELDNITKDNATKIAEIQAKASGAATKLQTLQSNTTLVATCQVVDAKLMEDDQCQQTFMLQRFVKFAANMTQVASATKNNATKIAAIELKASDAAVKLQTLQSNSTLQSACPAVMQEDECKAMNGLTKFVALANNATQLDKVTKGNATKEAEIKTMAAKARTQLSAMQGNATFMAACSALNSDSEKGTTAASATASGSSASATAKSAAGRVMQSSMFGVVVMVGVGMLML